MKLNDFPLSKIERLDIEKILTVDLVTHPDVVVYSEAEPYIHECFGPKSFDISQDIEWSVSLSLDNKVHFYVDRDQIRHVSYKKLFNVCNKTFAKLLPEITFFRKCWKTTKMLSETFV